MSKDDFSDLTFNMDDDYYEAGEEDIEETEEIESEEDYLQDEGEDFDETLAITDEDLDLDFEEDKFDSVDSFDTSDSLDQDDDTTDQDEELARLDAEIAAELEAISNNVETVADSLDFSDDESPSDGALLDEDTLMDEILESKVNKPYDDFISETGEIQLMDPNDSGDVFKLMYIDIDDIVVVGKRFRSSNNVEDLVRSIKTTGLLEPITVIKTSLDEKYALLDGYRRVVACARCGKRRIPCVINTKIAAPDAPVVEAMYNHSKKYTVPEIINYIDYLEKEKGIMSASLIEYLLQLNNGDYTKLKDILTDNDDDIVSKLTSGIYDIATAFKKLEQRRKKESAEEKEMKRAEKAYEAEKSDTEHIVDSGENADDGEQLSDEEISQLAITATDLDETEDEDLGDLIKEGNSVEGFQKAHKQDPKYRERLDPTLRKSVLVRDNNTCKVCNMISGMEFTEVLDVHHIQEVYLGGSDDIDNLITACTVCHKLIHLYGRGELNMRPIDQMTPEEQARFKKIVKLGTVIRKGMALRGMKREQLKKMDNTESIGRTKPGTGQVAG